MQCRPPADSASQTWHTSDGARTNTTGNAAAYAPTACHVSDPIGGKATKNSNALASRETFQLVNTISYDAPQTNKQTGQTTLPIDQHRCSRYNSYNCHI